MAGFTGEKCDPILAFHPKGKGLSSLSQKERVGVRAISLTSAGRFTMTTSAFFTIPARKGKAAFLDKGQRIKVINTHGQQVIDTWAFNRTDLTEFMSMEHSRTALSRIMARVGDSMVTNRRRPILALTEDTSPAFMTPCWPPATAIVTNSWAAPNTTITAPITWPPPWPS
jgi:uncharacterized protein YcgI (DUF1989 family)